MAKSAVASFARSSISRGSLLPLAGLPAAGLLVSVLVVVALPGVGPIALFLPTLTALPFWISVVWAAFEIESDRGFGETPTDQRTRSLRLARWTGLAAVALTAFFAAGIAVDEALFPDDAAYEQAGWWAPVLYIALTVCLVAVPLLALSSLLQVFLAWHSERSPNATARAYRRASRATGVLALSYVLVPSILAFYTVSRPGAQDAAGFFAFGCAIAFLVTAAWWARYSVRWLSSRGANWPRPVEESVGMFQKRSPDPH